MSIGMAYAYLAVAIVTEIIATGILPATDGFRKLKPSIIAILGYVICWYCFGMCLTQIGLGIAYATWGAIGTAATPIIGYFAYQQRTTRIGIFALVLIMVCVVLLNLYG